MILKAVDVRKQYPISYGEMELLIERCEDIVNFYGLAFDLTDRMVGFPGVGQVEKAVFEPLRRDRAARRAERGLPVEKSGA